jgi:hypothetical protein
MIVQIGIAACGAGGSDRGPGRRRDQSTFSLEALPVHPVCASVFSISTMIGSEMPCQFPDRV